MLALVMLASLCMAACGGDDEEDNDGGETNSSEFTITVNGEAYNYSNRNAIPYNFEVLSANFSTDNIFIDNLGSHFTLHYGGYMSWQLSIHFPKSKYGDYLRPSDFPVGYSDFGEDAAEVIVVSPSTEGWHGSPTGGTATVTKNDGNTISIKFSDYTTNVRRDGRSKDIIMNGVVDFNLYYS